MEPFRFHLFVCTQQMPDGAPCCSSNGSQALLRLLEREIAAHGISHNMQITTCGCLGLCDEGPIMIVYPEGIWYRHVRPSDIQEIVSRHFVGGSPVERLVWHDAPAMEAKAIEHEQNLRATESARKKAGMLPDHLNEMIRGYMPSRCILTALELDIFTAVGEGASAEEVGRRIHASSRSAAVLLNALVALGLLTKNGSKFTTTAQSFRYFAKGSKENHRDGLLHLANIWHRWSTLTDAILSGSRIPLDRAGTPKWTRDFIAAMDMNAKARAPFVAQSLGSESLRRVLDLGGGSGVYSIALAKAFPDVKCEILDLPEVVPLTFDYIHRAGCDSQITVLNGNMLEGDYGSGYDLIMLNAICHMFSEEQNRAIFSHACRALAPGGRLAVQDFILNGDKAGPLHAALFSINMFVGTDAGSSYTEHEYTQWMQDAGFVSVHRINLPGPADLIVGQVKQTSAMIR
jgi:(2Fe-2S) ferredoxin/predicted O-methyltransferase YrrM